MYWLLGAGAVTVQQLQYSESVLYRCTVQFFVMITVQCTFYSMIASLSFINGSVLKKIPFSLVAFLSSCCFFVSALANLLNCLFNFYRFPVPTVPTVSLASLFLLFYVMFICSHCFSCFILQFLWSPCFSDSFILCYAYLLPLLLLFHPSISLVPLFL